MAIRYPDKAVISGQSVIAKSNIPFLIMPGDGAANGCQFTGTAGAFTLAATFNTGSGAMLAGCYAYLSASFGGSELPAGWYWTEFSSDTAGIVYAETYTSGTPRRPATKTPISVNLTGWATATTNEVAGPTGFVLPSNALGKNGWLEFLTAYIGSITGTRSYRLRTNNVADVPIMTVGSLTSGPVGNSLTLCQNVDSHTVKLSSRNSASGWSGVGQNNTTLASQNKSFDTSVDVPLVVTLSNSSNLGAACLLGFTLKTTYGD